MWTTLDGERPFERPFEQRMPINPSEFDPTVPRSPRVPRLPADPDPTDRVGEYELGEELGRGGMGTVRRASDPRLRRDLAIRFLDSRDPAATVQFLEEAQITSQLQHPNIVPVYQLGVDEHGRPWLAMKRIEGESLADVIDDWYRSRPVALRPADIDTILGIFDRICDAIAFAHSRGVLHRDLKPQSIVVGEWGEVLVVDWGLARPISKPDRTAAVARPVRSDRRESGDDLAVNGAVSGTPAYMSPEQAGGRINDLDERSDIFSLGGILYTMLSYEKPYDGDSPIQVIATAWRHLLTPPRQRAPHRHIPRELDAIVMKAMAKDRRQRYQRVADLRADLDAYRASRPITARRDPLPSRVARWVRRHPVATMSASLSVLFVLVVAGLGAMWAVQSLEQRTRNAELAAQREAEKSRAEAAGHSAFRSHLRALAEARKFDELSAEVGAGISRKRDLARASLLNAFAMRPPGTSEEEYFRTIDPAQIDAQIAALEEAVKPANQARVFSDESDLCYLGMLYHFARHDPDRALASYNQAIEMNGRYVEAWVVRGWLMEQSGRHDEARRHWQTVLELDPTNAAATHNLALNLQAEDPERALALLQKAALLDDTAEMNCAVASQLGAMGRADQAGKAFRAVLARWPGYPGAHYGLALLARERNDGAEAVAQLDDALRANPDHVLARTARGTIRYGQNDMQGAAADFAVVVRLAPDNGDAWLLLAHARRVLGDAPGAIAAYERALPLNDADFDAHFHYSALVMARGDLDLARTHLDRAIAISPGNALAYIARGNVRFRTGDRPGAREDLERATQADPRNFDAWFGLGMVRRMLGDRDGAIAALRTAISVAPPTHFQLPEARQALRELTGE